MTRDPETFTILAVGAVSFLMGSLIHLSLAAAIGWFARRELAERQASRVQHWLADFWWLSGLIGMMVGLSILL